MADEKEPHRDPSEPDDGALDAETRMLQRIAALGGDQRDAEESAEASAEDEPARSDPVTYDPSVDTAEDATEQTETIGPVAGGGAGSTGNDDTPTEKPRKRRRWPWIIAAIVVLLGIGYVGAA
ncbi:MAG: hypothetical protein L0K46_07140, partial [Yaniella sp.]|nr:hypothetical protein [Yaniella sp.]